MGSDRFYAQTHSNKRTRHSEVRQSINCSSESEFSGNNDILMENTDLLNE